MLSVGRRFAAALLLVVTAVTASPALGAEPPDRATWLSAKPTTDSVTIAWKPAAGATHYAVCLRVSATSPCAHTSPRLTTTSHTFTRLDPAEGGSYVVRVYASNASGSSTSNPISFTLTPTSRPAAPQNATHRVLSSSSARISWEPVSGATSYVTCLTTPATTRGCARTMTTTATTATFTGLKPSSGTDYSYVVAAKRGSTVSPSSLKGGFELVGDPKPAAPTGLTHRALSPSTAEISWKPVPSASGYSVCLTTSGSAKGCAKVVTTTKTTTTLSGLKASGGTDYYYVVAAKRGSVASASSARGVLDLPVPAPAAPKVTPQGSKAATVSWKAVANADSYQVRMTPGTVDKNPSIHSSTTTSRDITSLDPKKTYSVSVRGLNDLVPSAWSSPTEITMPDGTAQVSLVTYNLCGQDKCVTRSNGMRSWASRKASAGAFIRSTNADIVTTQEDNDEDTKFITQLPGFGRAYYKNKTIYYDKAEYVLERAGAMTLDSARNRYAVWAQLRSIDTGGRFVVVDPHLEPYKGASKDKIRLTQTRRLIADTAKINTSKLPVVYAGDFNSNPSNADQSKYRYGFDAPRKAMAEAGFPDAMDVVDDARRGNSSFNSANQGINPPLRYGHHVDHVYVDKRITVNTWLIYLKFTGNRYTTPFPSDHNPMRVTLTIPAT